MPTPTIPNRTRSLAGAACEAAGIGSASRSLVPASNEAPATPAVVCRNSRRETTALSHHAISPLGPPRDACAICPLQTPRAIIILHCRPAHEMWSEMRTRRPRTPANTRRRGMLLYDSANEPKPTSGTRGTKRAGFRQRLDPASVPEQCCDLGGLARVECAFVRLREPGSGDRSCTTSRPLRDPRFDRTRESDRSDSDS